MFQFAAFALQSYVFSMQWPYGRVSPFGNLRIKACLPAPRSLSQATTSFIACNRQGIHPVHLFTCPYNIGLCCQRLSEQALLLLLSKLLSLIWFVCLNWLPTKQCTCLALSHLAFSCLINLYFFSIFKERNFLTTFDQIKNHWRFAPIPFNLITRLGGG